MQMLNQKNTLKLLSVAQEREKLPSRNVLSLWQHPVHAVKMLSWSRRCKQGCGSALPHGLCSLQLGGSQAPPLLPLGKFDTGPWSSGAVGHKVSSSSSVSCSKNGKICPAGRKEQFRLCFLPFDDCASRGQIVILMSMCIFPNLS